MKTHPRLPPDEVPLDAETVDRFLSSIGPGMVLVGGQALAFWMDRYGIKATGAVISNDGDALGVIAQAHDMALRLKARLVEPGKKERTALVAQLRIPAPGGKVANIDVLHLLYTISGLRKSSEFTRRVVRDSVEVEWRDGRFTRVMDPLDVLDSRVQNAAGLLTEKGPHVLTQAGWAIEVARAALLKLARAGDAQDSRLGRKMQAVYTLAHSRAGRTLLREHGIEVLKAVDIRALRKLAPGHGQQLDKVEEALRKRAAEASRPRASREGRRAPN